MFSVIPDIVRLQSLYSPSFNVLNIVVYVPVVDMLINDHDPQDQPYIILPVSISELNQYSGVESLVDILMGVISVNSAKMKYCSVFIKKEKIITSLMLIIMFFLNIFVYMDSEIKNIFLLYYNILY